jgi:hypothetical protein
MYCGKLEFTTVELFRLASHLTMLSISRGHVGSVISAIIAGSVAYMMYPNIQLCFLVIGASALVAIIFIRFVPQGGKK